MASDRRLDAASMLGAFSGQGNDRYVAVVTSASKPV